MSEFAVIGHGKVGGALLSILTHAGFTPAWVVSSKTLRGNRYQVHTALPAQPENARIVFITVPDGRIEPIARAMARLWGEKASGLIVYHLSGLLTSEALGDLAEKGAAVASLHPLQSILDPRKARAAFKGSIFTVEGDPRAVLQARSIVDALGGELMSIGKEDKVVYHTAAAIASNYLVSLLTQSETLMQSIGLERRHILPLVKGTLANIASHGRSALTGPISRADWSTVARHVKALEGAFPDILPSYMALGRYTSKLAAQHWPADLGVTSKLLDGDELARKAALMKRRGLKIVFTNGCFDILHAGHVAYLAQARSLGDCLILGLNADASVARLKGPGRPVNDQASRAAVLAGLESIDYISIFEEDTPYNLIARVRPDILVKGGDWRVEDIVGADIVKTGGGHVLSLPFKDGHSTTSIIEKLKES
ncbi:MAG: D-glycero-beta-D-manno-heptose 1-phosphate adenylyltransferase [Syntrophaceae bacterium]